MNRMMALLVALGITAAGGEARAQQTPRPQPSPRPNPQAAPAPGARAPGAMPGMNMGGMMARRGAGMGMDMGPMAMMMAPGGAGQILGMAQALQLTDAQTQQLRTLAEQARTATAPHMQAAMQAHHAAMQALEADAPDVAKYETQLREAANHFVEAQVTLARSVAQALAMLTPEQRANVRFASRLEHAGAMRGMMGGMPGMGGMNAPGMQPDMPESAGAAPGMTHDMMHPAPKPAAPRDTTHH